MRGRGHGHARRRVLGIGVGIVGALLGLLLAGFPGGDDTVTIDPSVIAATTTVPATLPPTSGPVPVSAPATPLSTVTP